jgi:type I restriction enzyme S subunit
MSEFCPDEGDLPEGWELPALADVVEINPPKPKPDALPAAAPVTFLPMAAVSEEGIVTDPQTRAFTEVRKGYTAFADGDVILAKITPCFENGKAALVGRLTNGLGFGSSEFHVLRSLGGLLPKFVFHYFHQPAFRQDAAESMSGTAGQARVTTDYMRGLSIPLPPLAEQRRIVEKVEALLAQVNAARARLAKVPTILKRFRQSILSAACSGRLTKPQGADRSGSANFSELDREWDSEAFGDLPPGWRAVRLADVLQNQPGAMRTGPFGSLLKKHEHVARGVQVFGIENVRPLRFVPGSKIHITREKAAALAEYDARSGDVLITRSGTVGQVCVVPAEAGEARFSTNIVRLRLDAQKCAPWFFAYLITGSDAVVTQAGRETAGSTRDFLNQRILSSVLFPMPPLSEQHEIVRRVDALFKLADAIEARVAAATARADKITRAILAKAFRGELVPTEAELARQEGRDYEPASVLLARIRTARANSKAASNPATRTPRRRVTAVR